MYGYLRKYTELAANKACNYQRSSLYLFILWVLLSACDPAIQKPIERPLDPWAFRSVLDKKPRMLTLALDTACYAAYDLERSSLYKLWKGGVTLEGTVYTNKKNIQPTSWGTSYMEQDRLPSRWVVLQNREAIGFEIQHKGYSLRNGQIILRFQLVLKDGTIIDVHEKPEFIRDSQGKPGFSRTFLTHNVPENISIGVGSADEVFYLRSNAESEWKAFFEPLPEQHPSALRDQYDHLGILWMENSDCYTCHEEKNRMVGPSFVEIANQYEKGREVYAQLGRKIVEGGAGVWGETPMNPHPGLSEGEIKTMLDYIFTFKTESFQEKNQQPLVQQAAITDDLPSEKPKPGFGAPLEGVHPSYDLVKLHNENFKPRVGALAVLPDGGLLVSTWDNIGGVYLLRGIDGDPENIEIKRIAEGLAEPLGLEVVDGDIYVLQKHELTRLVDTDGDDIIDEYQVVCNSWGVTDDFHEFAFGLLHKDDHFYITLSMAMRLMAHERQHPDRGRTLKISKDGSFEALDYGLRTPNGIGEGIDGQIFVTDNQGQWLPGNKLIHVQPGAYNGMAWGLSEEEEQNPPEMVPPAIWLPDKEIGNSPSEPILMRDGPYKGQMLHGDVTNGGIKRDFIEKVDGVYQGAVFRFSQGFTAGVNRLAWGPDGALYVGEVGMVGGWSWKENQYGLEKIKYNGKSTFEMLAIRAKPGGFEIEFTEPLADRELAAEDIKVEQWWYLPTAAYGGPKMDHENLMPAKVDISQDRKKIYLDIPGLKQEHVVYFRLADDIESVEGQNLWSSEAWYTLNRIPSP